MAFLRATILPGGYVNVSDAHGTPTAIQITGEIVDDAKYDVALTIWRGRRRRAIVNGSSGGPHLGRSRYMRGLMLVTLILGAVACGGGATSPRDQWSGTYDLTAINGRPLPYVYDTTWVGSSYEQDAVLAEQLQLWAPTAITETEIDRVSTNSGVTADTTGFDGYVQRIQGDSIFTQIGWGARSGGTLTLAVANGATTEIRTYVRRP